jgi:hypothetical protein
VRGRTKADIDCDAHKEIGYSVIAVGGDGFSRGLTLSAISRVPIRASRT